MNKLNVFALLLLVAAGSQLLAAQNGPADEAKASDTEEVAALDEKSDALRGFCLEVRDYVANSMQSRADTLKTALAGMFKSTRDQLRSHSQQVQERAKLLSSEENLRKVDELAVRGQQSLSERLAKAPLRPSSLLGGAKRALSKASHYMVEQQRALGRRLQESPVEPSAVFNSARAALNQASGAFKKGLSSARDATARMMGDTCRLIGELDAEIQRRFEALKASDQSLAALSLEEVECVTVASVSQMRKACREQKVE